MVGNNFQVGNKVKINVSFDINNTTINLKLKVIVGSIKDYLKANGFHEITDLFSDDFPNLQSEKGTDNRSFLITDFSQGYVKVTNLLTERMDELLVNGLNSSGFITDDNNLCDGKFYQLNNLYDNSSSQYNIWHHIIVDPETGENILYEKINDYNGFLDNTILKREGYLNHPCGVTSAIPWPFDEDCFIPCHGTKRAGRCGNVFFNGTVQHWIIEIDYVCNMHPFDYSKAEYFIPGSSSSGGPGYVDIANLATGELFEIKSSTIANSGIEEIETYVAQANLLCPTLISGIWSEGQNYPAKILPDPTSPGNSMEVELTFPGVITYEATTLQPEPVFLPASAYERIRILIKKLGKNIEDIEIEREIARFLGENPLLALRLREAIISVGVGIIVGTIIEDFLPAAGGPANDPASFYLGWRLIQIAI